MKYSWTCFGCTSSDIHKHTSSHGHLQQASVRHKKGATGNSWQEYPGYKLLAWHSWPVCSIWSFSHFFVYLQLYITFINITCTQNRIFRKWEWEGCNNNKTICKEPTVDTQLWITVFYMQGFHCVNICVLSALAGESSLKNAAQPMRWNEKNLILWFCKNIAVHGH